MKLRGIGYCLSEGGWSVICGADTREACGYNGLGSRQCPMVCRYHVRCIRSADLIGTSFRTALRFDINIRLSAIYRRIIEE